MIENLDSAPQLYRTLLGRRSCRRFEAAPLSQQNLQEIQDALRTVEPLQSGQHIQFALLNELEKSRLAVAQGAYGRFIVSPHLMIPYSTNASNPLIELGYQSQQAVILLEEMGLGSCYIGAHNRVRKLQHEFDLPEASHLAAVLIYGTPTPSAIIRNLDQSYRSLIGSRKRKPATDILLTSDEVHPANLPREWEAILEGGRWAPSATNAQPWVLLPLEDGFHLYTNPAAYPIVLTAGSKLMYALYDAGIFMANISLAAQAWGVHAHWHLQHESHLLERKSLIPVARLSFT
jgi:nitroreductase